MTAIWNAVDPDAECARAYRRYLSMLRTNYTGYFASRPDLAGEHRYKACDLGAALPSGHDWLGKYLPERLRHRHHLSGLSSQVVALGLLGAAWRTDLTLEWLFDALRLPPAPPTDPVPEAGFERELDTAVLDEAPYVTTLDYWAETPELFLAVEAKWSEAGVGGCGCGVTASAVGACSAKVRSRARYWDAARETFALPDRQDGVACPIARAYQAVRCVAAARALAGPGKRACFALLYDARNPYFTVTGDWPGWPNVLTQTLAGQPSLITFVALSWQELAAKAPLDEAVKLWAREKHQLPV